MVEQNGPVPEDVYLFGPIADWVAVIFVVIILGFAVIAFIIYSCIVAIYGHIRTFAQKACRPFHFLSLRFNMPN